MQIGEIIRHYRKNKNMTQEEMANRLGVTAPAVNKWENGGSMPDIMLLSPISRLLGITPDELLSFHETLTPEEINGIVREMDSMFQEKPYEEVFEWARKKLEEYPSCEQLIWQLAIILDARRMTGAILGEDTQETESCAVSSFVISPNAPTDNMSADNVSADTDKYDAYICSLYERVLESDDEALRTSGADSLFGFYMRKKQYDKAEEYLQYFSMQNPVRKRKQAEIYDATGRIREAFKTWEELLFTEYGMLNTVLHGMYLASLRDNDLKKAHLLVEKEVEMAKCFEMGKYHEASPRLELAALEKDAETVIATMQEMLSGLNEICGFCRSRLYEHMEFKPVSPEFAASVRKDLLDCFRDGKDWEFLKEDERWHDLIK